MVSYPVKVVIFSTAMQFFSSVSALIPTGPAGLLQTHGALIARRGHWGYRSPQVDAHVMLQGWSSLNEAVDQCQSVFQQGSSLELAVKAAITLSHKVTEVNSQYGQCACNGPSATEVSAHFGASVTHFFAALQVILKTGTEKYGSAWGRQFRPIFQSCSPAFATMKTISASLQIDLATTLNQVHLDLNLFTTVGLNINALLGLDFEIGGIINSPMIDRL